MSTGAVHAALAAAWSGADPGPRSEADRPAAALAPPGPTHPLPRRPAGGLGGLLDLALAGDPHRLTGGVRLRRVPSAGGRYPVDLHVAGPGGPIPYDPLTHALGAPAPTGDSTLLLSLSARRTAWRYGPRSLPVLLLDLGHALAALLAAARAVGTPARGFVDGRLPAPAVAAVLLGPAPTDPGTTRLRGAVAVTGCDVLDRALAVLGDHLPATGIVAPPAVRPRTLLTRRSAAWTELTADHPAAAAAAWRAAHAVTGATPDLDLDLVEVTRTDSPTLLDALSTRCCGQPALAGAARVLLVVGAPDPGPRTLPALVTAGAAVHAGWLAAITNGGLARPVGCWVDARMRLAGRPRRVLHALALGEPAAPGAICHPGSGDADPPVQDAPAATGSTPRSGPASGRTLPGDDARTSSAARPAEHGQ